VTGKRIELDDLLRVQDRPTIDALLATIEKIEGDPDRIRITPFLPGVGCLCFVALAVRKDAIGSLTTTDELHRCCGKTLNVVEVDFVEDTLRDVFSQLMNSASQKPTDPSMHNPAPHPPSLLRTGLPTQGSMSRSALGASYRYYPGSRSVFECQTDYEACLGQAWSDFDRCMCLNNYRTCVDPLAPLMFC
jgi:hypothetical protein